MIKMPCLYMREFEKGKPPVLTENVTPGCEWIIAGEGTASIKRDGTACMFHEGKLWKRYDAKRGKQPPMGAIQCSAPDPETGHWPHWIPITEQDKYHQAAFVWDKDSLEEGATYELCGPMVNRNPEKLERHRLIKHGAETVMVPPGRALGRLFQWLSVYLECNFVEGLVFAHPDGRFAKIRRKDFGFAWPAESVLLPGEKQGPT